MKINNKLLWFILSLLIISISSVLAQFPATVEEGETRTFNLGGNIYNIELLIVEDTDPPTATFTINNQVTTQLTIGTSQTMPSGITINVIDIFLNEAGEAGSGDTVTFSLTNYCGDNVCNSNENCGTCASDCGCQEGYFCQNNYCNQIVCGDDICSNNEMCEQDNCCYGQKNINFERDRTNCGACDNRCGFKESCINGVCEKDKYCGDGICEINEKDNCKFDCFKEVKKQIKPSRPKTKINNLNKPIEEQNKPVEQPKEEVKTTEVKQEESNQGFIKKLFNWLNLFFKE